MKTFVFIAILAAVRVGAALNITPPQTHPDHPGQCWIESKQLAVRPGELFYNSTDCTGYECFADLSHRVTSCGFGALNRGEEIPIDDHVIWSFYE